MAVTPGRYSAGMDKVSTATEQRTDATAAGRATFEDAYVPAPAAEGSLLPAPLRLSFSQVDTYQNCPLKYRFGYIEKLPTEPSPHLSWGSSIHYALERWWDQKLPTAPSVEELLRGLYDGWDDIGFAGMERDEKLQWYRHAQQILRRHHDQYASQFVPAMATEEWFDLDLGDGISVVGSIDHVTPTSDGGFGILDWKTNRKAKNRKQVASSLQLAIYALAAEHLWGRSPDWVALEFVVPGVRVAVSRDEIDTDGAVRTIHQVAAKIRAEEFAPSPNPLCNWCDFRSECPAFEGDGPDVAGTAVVELKKLQRRRARDDARMQHLEQVVRDRLGEEAVVEVQANEP